MNIYRERNKNKTKNNNGNDSRRQQNGTLYRVEILVTKDINKYTALQK